MSSAKIKKVADQIALKLAEDDSAPTNATIAPMAASLPSYVQWKSIVTKTVAARHACRALTEALYDVGVSGDRSLFNFEIKFSELDQDFYILLKQLEQKFKGQ